MKKFTILELVIVIAILGTLITILFPALSKARTKAQFAVCVSNNRQLSVGMTMYSVANNGWICPPYQGDNEKNKVWSMHTIFPVYIDSQNTFKCPTDTVSLKSYGPNGGATGRQRLVAYGESLKRISEVAPDTYLLVEKRASVLKLEKGWPDINVFASWVDNHWYRSKPWHNGPLSYSFIDGHVEGLRIPIRGSFTPWED